eukprot:807182-Prymnesium_polylepis.2
MRRIDDTVDYHGMRIAADRERRPRVAQRQAEHIFPVQEVVHPYLYFLLVVEEMNVATEGASYQQILLFLRGKQNSIDARGRP